MQLRLVPLDDSILFPGMTATIAADVGDAEQVFVAPAPRRRVRRASAPSPRWSRRAGCPAASTSVTLTGLHRGRAGTAAPGPDGELMIEVEELPDATYAGDRIRELEREYRAVVEEILELRGDDGRVAAFLRSISEPGALADTSGYSPDLTPRRQAAAARDGRRHRAARAGARAAARAARRASGPQADPRRRRGGRQRPAARVLPAQADGVDPQGARRGRRLGRRGVRDEDRRVGDARRRPRAGPARARPARAHGRAERRVVDDPHLPRLAARRAVGRALRRAPRPGRRPRGARRRPRRPRGRQGPDHRVHRRARPAPRARARPTRAAARARS